MTYNFKQDSGFNIIIDMCVNEFGLSILTLSYPEVVALKPGQARCLNNHGTMTSN